MFAKYFASLEELVIVVVDDGDGGRRAFDVGVRNFVPLHAALVKRGPLRVKSVKYGRYKLGKGKKDERVNIFGRFVDNFRSSEKSDEKWLLRRRAKM